MIILTPTNQLTPSHMTRPLLDRMPTLTYIMPITNARIASMIILTPLFTHATGTNVLQTNRLRKYE